MAVTKDEILEAIAQMSVMDVVELVKAMEEKFGVSAAAAVAVAAAPAAGSTAAVEEKTSFKVEMTSFGANKLSVIKIVREITGLGLKEAKDLVEGVPSVIKDNVAKDEAESIKAKLVEAGATVELK